MTQKFKEDQHSKNGQKNITRKEALLKAGKYAAFTAAAMMAVLGDIDGQPRRPPKKSPVKPRPRRPKQKKASREDLPPSY
ncbi:MAG TPA: hypothetical protein PLT53_03875 [Prolixibacteraceae bacterium]|nr:MAG: hypothetical protein BWX87_02243 [Bacteroidetes bacterium ADurb.Bin123]HNZ70214.1 hypothetical protein [Prolixibacteraceae bacterium]HPV18137.1 hypothetical protein [Prolixibacteraceae bacterium]HPY27202.1 hypothetical protein [Prolixibacteraceae bacterium]